jgi:hypothetical protein
MKNFICLILISILTAACGGTKTPSWYSASNQQMDRFEKNYLAGEKADITELNFNKAVEEIKKSGDLDRLEKVWLTRMALQIAMLKEPDGGDYKKIEAVQPIPENSNYYSFLAGNITEVDDALLPRQYRKFYKALAGKDLVGAGNAIAAIEDNPVSQLIAAGLAVRNHLESEEIIQAAVNAASVNGWKAALLAWLERMAAFYESKGETTKARTVRQRMELISG